MSHNDEEQKKDAVEEPHINHLDVSGDREWVRGAAEEGVEDEEGREAHGQTDLHKGEKIINVSIYLSIGFGFYINIIKFKI